ncbi:hypothetical protein DLJ96_00095, partial [Actinotalea fermentans ATCC 43279 = JCM 9966 = DSM 3133]
PAPASPGGVPASGSPGSGERTGGLSEGPGDGSAWDLGGLGEPFPEDDDAEHGLVDDALGEQGPGADDAGLTDEKIEADHAHEDVLTGGLLATR